MSYFQRFTLLNLYFYVLGLRDLSHVKPDDNMLLRHSICIVHVLNLSDAAQKKKTVEYIKHTSACNLS